MIALSIAGFDPTTGAGVGQDLRTFDACGVWGFAAITALTEQTSAGVHAVHPIDPEIVRAQILSLAGDAAVQAAKTGMLATAAIVRSVAGALSESGIERIVVDPVLASGANACALLDAAGVQRLISDLIPNATLVTPNSVEASILTGIAIETRADQRKAAAVLREMGAAAALVKGGHLEGEDSIDVLDDGSSVCELVAPRIQGGNVHGTGCVLSAAIAAFLAEGRSIEQAVREAKGVVTGAIERAQATRAGALVANPRPAGGPWGPAGHPFEWEA